MKHAGLFVAGCIAWLALVSAAVWIGRQTAYPVIVGLAVIVGVFWWTQR